jgi:hypothetical protein
VSEGGKYPLGLICRRIGHIEKVGRNILSYEGRTIAEIETACAVYLTDIYKKSTSEVSVMDRTNKRLRPMPDAPERFDERAGSFGPLDSTPRDNKDVN